MAQKINGLQLKNISVTRQDNTTNSTANNIILTGIGVITNGTTKAVTFGVTFTSIPVVLTTNAGGNGSGGGYAYPSVGGLTGAFTDRVISAVGQTVTGFTGICSGTAPTSGQGITFTWMAIGTI